MVHYQGTKVHPRLGIDHQLLPPVEFLALLVPHILLRYQVSSRLYGAISTRTRKRLGWIEHPPTQKPPPEHGPAPDFLCPPHRPKAAISPLSEASPPRPPEPERHNDTPFLRARRRSWARLIHRTWLCDPELCPVCGQRMKVVAAITSPAQDDVIEKVLRHIGRWDPPWKSGRRARAPPDPKPPTLTPGGEAVEDSVMIDPQWDVDSYMVDPPSPEDA